MISTQEIVVRLLAALLLCGAVGLQRALTGKAASTGTEASACPVPERDARG